MPLLSTFGNAGIRSYGTAGIQPGGSALYDSANDYLQVPASTAFQYGTGDFTIEMWIYPTVANGPAGNGVTLFVQRGADYNTQRYLFLFLWPTRQIFLQVPGNDFFIGTQNLVTLNAWNHVALVRQSGSMRIFLNGYANNARANTTNYTDASAYAPAFGSLVFNNQYTFQGNITNIRVAKSAYYTATFDPTRTPFTRTSQGATNVQLLLNVRNTTSLSTDSSANNITVTNNTVTFNSLTPYVVPYVAPAGVTPVSATVTPSTLSGSEGSTITVTVVGTNTTNGTYYYTVEQATGSTAVTTADFTSASLSGSFTITSNSGSFTITPTKDLLTEGTERFSLVVRSTSITGQIIGASEEITITDVSLTPTVTPAANNVNEGASLTFTAANLGPNGTYYWSINHVTTAAADFSAENGSFSITGGGAQDNGTGTFSVTPILDFLTEGAETFTVSVRTGSVGGTILATSSTVTVNDTSVTNYAVSATPTSFNEGAATVATFTGAPNGTYFWTVLNGTTTNADFTATSGSFTSTSGTGSFSVTAATLGGAEAAETFSIQVRTVSTSGTVVATTGTLTINVNAT